MVTGLLARSGGRYRGDMGSDSSRGLRKRWSELSSGQRRLIVVAGVFEAFAKVAMLRDLRRRPADEIRGPKLLWAATALVNTAGLAQVGYFVVGRRHPS
jgi:hypothetical protein